MSELPAWARYDGTSLNGILRAALDAFADHGYDGTSIRDIAAGAQLSVPGVYHHFASKQQILTTLMEDVLRDLLSRTRAALAGADTPSTRFDALVECLVRFHMFRQAEAFVASTELRSLDEASRRACVALRDEVEELLVRVIGDGCEDGAFLTRYPADAARAVATVCVGVAGWYRPTGSLAPDEVVERQLAMLRSLVGAVPES